MNRTTLFPALLGLALSAVACNGPTWTDAGAIDDAAATPVPELVDAARRPAPPAPTATATPKTAATTKAQPATPAPVEPVADPDADIYVKRLVIAHGVESREPVGPAETFTQGEADRIYAFVEMGNRDDVASAISVSFEREGEPKRGGVELRVGASPRWRTWSYTRTAKGPGVWFAVVRALNGKELARARFEIVSGTTTPQASLDLDDGEPLVAPAA